MVIGPIGVQFRRSVIIRVINQTELDDTKFCYRLLNTMKKFEKQTNHRLNVFANKNITFEVFQSKMHEKMNPIVYITARANDAYTYTIHRHDVDA